LGVGTHPSKLFNAEGNKAGMKQRAGAVIFDRNKVFLMHRIKGGSEYWVLPGGSVEGDESLEQACCREIKEETGLEIEITRLAFRTENRGRIKSYFYANKIRGSLQIGEPEKSRATATNRYSLVWVSPRTCGDLDIRPNEIRVELVKLLADGT
jgi:ADP-ribose pyrophosphatase YjhB (NUDIX family)